MEIDRDICILSEQSSSSSIFEKTTSRGSGNDNQRSTIECRQLNLLNSDLFREIEKVLTVTYDQFCHIGRVGASGGHKNMSTTQEIIATKNTWGIDDEKYEVVKRQNIEKFLEKFREEMNSWLERCFSRETTIKKVTSFMQQKGTTEELLTLLEQQQNILRDYCTINQEIHAKLTLWYQLMDHLVLKKSSDGQNASKSLPQSKKTIKKQLTQVEKDIKNKLKDWSIANNGQQFLVFGKPIDVYLSQIWNRNVFTNKELKQQLKLRQSMPEVQESSPQEESTPSPPVLTVIKKTSVDSTDIPCTEKSSTSSAITCDTIICHNEHVGHEFLNETFSIEPNKLFDLMFSIESKFFANFLSKRKTYNITINDWQKISDDSGVGGDFSSRRELIYDLELNNPIAKTLKTTEIQYLETQCVPGHFYAVKSVINHTGVPLSRNFTVFNYYCITRSSDGVSTNFLLHSEIIFTKFTWGLKSAIENDFMNGMKDYASDLRKAFHKIIQSSVHADDLSQADNDESRASEKFQVNDDNTSDTERNESEVKAYSSDFMAQEASGNSGKSTFKSPKDTLISSLLPGVERKMETKLHFHSNLGEAGIVGGDNFLAKLVITVLVLLFFLNIFLYYRLWNLENVADELSSMFYSLPAGDSGSAIFNDVGEDSNYSDLTKQTVVAKNTMQFIKSIENNLNVLKRQLHKLNI